MDESSHSTLPPDVRLTDGPLPCNSAGGILDQGRLPVAHGGQYFFAGCQRIGALRFKLAGIRGVGVHPHLAVEAVLASPLGRLQQNVLRSQVLQSLYAGSSSQNGGGRQESTVAAEEDGIGDTLSVIGSPQRFPASE